MDSENTSTINSTCVLDPVFINPNTTHPSFHDSGSTVRIEDEDEALMKEENCIYKAEKKRRLAGDQLQFLERSFEAEKKLEPERKLELAKQVGLQPKQVAIWFQNRRARYKTKQIQKDFDSLKARFHKLKALHDSISKENENLRHQVQLLTDKLLIEEQQQGKTKPNKTYDAEPDKIPPKVENFPVCKNENGSTAKSDILDSDSPQYYTDGNHSNSHAFESDEDDHSLISNQPFCMFPKLEDHGSQTQPSLCNLGFPIEDQIITSSSWLWPC